MNPSQAALRSIASLEFVFVYVFVFVLVLVRNSRSRFHGHDHEDSALDLFEQPARGFFRSSAANLILPCSQ